MRPTNNPTGEFYLNNPQRAKSEITVLLKFTQTGKLKGILLNAQNDRDQDILWKGIERLIKPLHFGWVRGLFK